MMSDKPPRFKFATADGVETSLGTLKYSLGASKRINAFFGNFSEAFPRLMKFDIEAFSAVAAAGLGMERKDVEDAVFDAGYDTLLKPLMEYLAWLSAGGREPQPVTNAETDSGNV
jgi:hypothetical protein